MNEPLKRKALRLKEFDYSAEGMYFVTVCTQNKQCLLSEVVGAIPKGLVLRCHESPAPPLRDTAQPKRSELSRIVGNFKMQVSKRMHEIDPTLQVWQRGYYDHIIRGYEDYKTKAEYIATNPLRWLYHCSGEAYR